MSCSQFVTFFHTCLVLLLPSLLYDNNNKSWCCAPLQVLRYFDYVFTGVFTFEMLIKVTKYQCVSTGLDVCGDYVVRLVRRHNEHFYCFVVVFVC